MAKVLFVVDLWVAFDFELNDNDRLNIQTAMPYHHFFRAVAVSPWILGQIWSILEISPNCIVVVFQRCYVIWGS